MEYFIDADIFGLTLADHPVVAARMIEMSACVYLSSVTIEEIVGAQINQVNTQRSRSTVGVGTASDFLVLLVAQMSSFSLEAYSDAAEDVFRRYPASVRRIGAMDCRLAAHATVLGFTIVTRNVSDFSRIPGIVFEDWSV